MKIKLLMIVIVAILLSGCENDVDYENDEMSNMFFNINSIKLDKAGIDSISSYLEFNKWSGDGCRLTMRYSNGLFGKSIKFKEDEIISHGKEAILNKANDCVNGVIKRTELDKDIASARVRILDAPLEKSINQKIIDSQTNPIQDAIKNGDL